MNDELWRVIASGGLNLLLAEMQSITNIDTRARLLDPRDFLRWLRVELAAPTSLAFAISEAALGLLWDEVQGDAYYAPVLRTQDLPMVENAASDGTTLTADTPPAGYTTFVWSFNGLVFTELGELSANATPSNGNYVLANKNDNTPELVGLPSLFLAIA